MRYFLLIFFLVCFLTPPDISAQSSSQVKSREAEVRDRAEKRLKREEARIEFYDEQAEAFQKVDKESRFFDENGSPIALPPTFTNYGGIFPGPMVAELDKKGKVDPKTGERYLTERLAPSWTNTFLLFLLMISPILIMIGGVMYITSAGDQEMRSTAVRNIRYAIFAMIIGILSYTVIDFILGINFSMS